MAARQPSSLKAIRFGSDPVMNDLSDEKRARGLGLELSRNSGLTDVDHC